MCCADGCWWSGGDRLNTMVMDNHCLRHKWFMRSDVKPEKLIQSGIIMIIGSSQMTKHICSENWGFGVLYFFRYIQIWRRKMNSFVWNRVGNSSLHYYYDNDAWKTVNVNNRYEKLSYWKEKKFPNWKFVFSKEVDFPDRPWWHLYIPTFLDSRK